MTRIVAVSYTHLDVYKRQDQEAQGFQHIRLVVGDQDPRHIRIVESHGAVNNIVAFQRQLLYHS